MEKRVRVFFCYARKDQIFLNALKTHLRPLERQGLISMWHDADISPGTEWEEEIRSHLDIAHIILLLISPDFMNSEYCYSREMSRAMERHECGEAHVIPIILRPVYWQGAPFGKLQALPKGAKPITRWSNRDDALFDVAEGIRKAAETAISSWERAQVARQAESESVWKQVKASLLPLDFIWIISSSRSMSGGKIQSLNAAVREYIPDLRRVADNNSHAIVRVHAITFSTGAYWHVSAPLENLQWPDVTVDVTAGGERDMGQALSKVAEYLSLLRVTRKRGLPPVLVLITDGYATDDVERGIKAIMDEPWGRKAVRIAIGIGADADYGMLERFIGSQDGELKPLQANNADHPRDAHVGLHHPQGKRVE